MIELIIILIVGYYLYKKVKNDDSGFGKKNGSLGSGTPSVSVTPANKHTERKQQRMFHQNTMQNSRKTEQKKAPAGSTTAYLNEKAQLDAMEHAREKREETERLHRNYGGLRVAQRLYEGDSVPEGRKCVVCGYCGAENLLPMVPKEKYSCYFCREPLN